MSATYDDSLPTARDRVRLSLGDTNVDPESNALLSDETLDALLTEHGETMAIITAAEALATKFGQEPDSVRLADGKTVTWKDRVKAWLELASRLRAATSSEEAAANNTAVVVRTLRRHEESRGEYYREEWVPWSPQY